MIRSKESSQKAVLTRKCNGKPWHTEEAKSKIGKANKIALKGRKIPNHHSGWVINSKTIEKARIGRANSEKWQTSARSDQKRNKISLALKGRKHSIESRKKMSEAAKLRLKNGNFTNPISKSEAAFGDGVYQKFKIILESQIWIDGRCFDYKVPNKKILIECDSNYWHSLPESKENDKLKNEIAEKNGFKLIRYKIDTAADAKRIIKENAAEIKKLLQ